MKDFAPEGTGNSRYLKSSIPSTTTWEQMRSMLRGGTFPFDFNGINPAGVAEIGTPINKNSLLNDETALDLWFDIDDNPTPSDALQNIYKVGDIKATVRKTLGDKWLVCNGQKVFSKDILELKEVFENDTISILKAYRPSNSEIEYQGEKWYLVNIKKINGEYIALYKPYYNGEDYMHVMFFRSEELKSSDILNDWEYVGKVETGYSKSGRIVDFFKFKDKYVLATNSDVSNYGIYILISNSADSVHDITSFSSKYVRVSTGTSDDYKYALYYIYNDILYLFIKNPNSVNSYVVSTNDLVSFSDPNKQTPDNIFDSDLYCPHPIFYNQYVISYYYRDQNNLYFSYFDITADTYSYKKSRISNEGDALGYVAHIYSSFVSEGYLYLCSNYNQAKNGIIKVKIENIFQETDYYKLIFGEDFFIVRTPENMQKHGIFLYQNEKYLITSNNGFAPFYIYRWDDDGNCEYVGHMKNISPLSSFSYQFYSENDLVYLYDYSYSYADEDPYLFYIFFYGIYSEIPLIENESVGVNTFIKYKK